MKGLRRICALGVSGLVIGGLMSGVAISTAASAPLAAPLARDTPEVFHGTAAAHALQLGLFGTHITVSSSNVVADSSPKAHADGSGVALIAATTSNADAVGTGQSAAPPQACGLNLPLTGILNLALACSQSASQTTSAAPSAVATSHIAQLDVQALSTVLALLQPILNALTPIADQVLGTVITTVQSVVQPILGNTLTQLLAGLGIQPTAPVSSLITALTNATNLLTVHVGDTISKVVTSAGTVVADSDAQGATIALLPALGVLTITVGAAHTTSTFNRATGASSATFDPSILTVCSSLLGLTPAKGNCLKVGLGSPIVLFAGTPLASSISLGAGSTTKNTDGSASAVADAVSIKLLTGLSGGITLDLAHAESTAGGSLATVTPPTTAAPATTTPTTAAAVITGVAKQTLATTGTDEPLLPVGLALLLCGYLTRRIMLRRRAARTPR